MTVFASVIGRSSATTHHHVPPPGYRRLNHTNIYTGHVTMIRRCKKSELDVVYEIINDAATAYKGVIPGDRWKDPYMPRDELDSEIEDGIEFWGYEDDGKLVGVMGIQDVGDVTLIRHAYVMTRERRKGVGAALLQTLVKLTDKQILIGTWAAARWAVSFYEKHGFRLVTEEEKNRLLKKYWKIPERQIETSVVLAQVSAKIIS
jgi:N-acetylglutamate synthase-like GNAT family acetyltransferase